MIPFLIGIVCGMILAVFCIGMWAVWQEDKEDKK